MMFREIYPHIFRSIYALHVLQIDLQFYPCNVSAILAELLGISFVTLYSF